MGAREYRLVILRAGDVVDLQFYLMDVAKRYVVCGGERTAAADELLANAAALDYALLLASEHGDEPLAAATPVAESISQTMTRAAECALDFTATIPRAPADTYADFMRRWYRTGGIFDTLRSLRESGAVAAPDVAFRALTTASDLLERRKRG